MMKKLNYYRRVSIDSICLIVLLMMSVSSAEDPFSGGSSLKKNEERSKWSLSIFGAMAFGGKIDNRSSISGFDGPNLNFSENHKYSFLSKIRPTSWMIQVDYSMTNVLGAAALYSNSDLGKLNLYTDDHPEAGRLFSGRIHIHTISVLLLVKFNDYIIFGIGPAYNMTSTPSAYNKLGLLAQLNFRIPVNNYMSLSGIAQYRYIGGAIIGPYYAGDSEDVVETGIATNTQIFPPTELRYSHLFIGLGVTISYKR